MGAAAHCGPIKAMRRGGMIRGPGTGTSDSIPAMMPGGSYIEPADTSLRVSNGESAFTPKQEQSLGAAILEMMRQMTHQSAGAGGAKPRPFSAMAKAYAKGGYVKGYADGGEVDDQPKPDQAAAFPAAYASQSSPSTMANQAGGAITTLADAAMPGTMATVRGSYGDAASQFNQGNIAAGVGQAIRGLATVPLAAADDFVGRPVRAAGPVAGAIANAAYTAATGNNTPAFGAAAPQAGTPVPTPRTDVQTGGSAGPVATAQQAVAAPAPAPGGNITIDGTDASGRPNSFSGTNVGPVSSYVNPNGTASSFGSGSVTRTISPQNDAAAQALSDRYAAGSSGPIATAGAGGPPQSYIPGVNAPLTEYQKDVAARNAAVGAPRGLTRLGVQQSIANQQSATSRLNSQEAAGASRYGADQGLAGHGIIAGVTAQGQQLRNQVDMGQLGIHQQQADLEARAKTGIISAQSAYLNAKTPAERVAAEETLRALGVGKDRNIPDLYDKVQTGVDPRTLAPIFSIYSKRTGQVSDQPAQTEQTPAGLTVGAPTKANKDGVYTFNGKTYTVRGGKFVDIR